MSKRRSKRRKNKTKNVPAKSAQDSAEVFQKDTSVKYLGQSDLDVKSGTEYLDKPYGYQSRLDYGGAATFGGCYSCQTRLIFEKDGLKVWAGSKTSISDLYRHGFRSLLAIDLHGETSYEFGFPTLEANAEARKLLGPDIVDAYPLKSVPTLRIEWPDYGVPADLKEVWWWRALADKIKDWNGNITINCLGGHGRTGTMLAVLAHFLGVIPEGADPVTWVREKGCKEMVESAEQITFIEELTGRKVSAEGAKVYATIPRAVGTKPSGQRSFWGESARAWANKTFPLPGDDKSRTAQSLTDEQRRTGCFDDEDVPLYDLTTPPEECDTVALSKLTDQTALDSTWDRFLGGDYLPRPDRHLCQWLAQRFFDQFPDADIYDGEYDVEGQEWCLISERHQTEQLGGCGIGDNADIRYDPQTGEIVEVDLTDDTANRWNEWDVHEASTGHHLIHKDGDTVGPFPTEEEAWDALVDHFAQMVTLEK